jgi:TetR/AcrR family transcriptional repressor of mexJK operon
VRCHAQPRLISPQFVVVCAPLSILVDLINHGFDGLSKKGAASDTRARKAAPARPSPGRPTRAQAQQRHAQLLDTALEVFLEYGYEQATIDTIIAAIGMHKSTVYSLYPDKEALFRATVERAIRRWVQPIEVLKEVETDDLEATLIAIARLRLENSISPLALKLQRIVIAESFRVPEITRIFYEQGVQSSMEYLTDLLARRARLGEIAVDQPELMAHGFFTLTVGLITRMILMGTKIDQREIDRRVRLYVRLFLNGIRPKRVPS